MFLDNFFKAIGHFFEGLFNAAQKTWNKLSPEIQQAMLHGSGIIATINDNVDKAPQFVFDLIQTKFPDLTKEKIEEVLKKGAEGLAIAEGINDTDVLTVIQRLQTYLSGLQGKTWARISQTLSLAIAAVLAPGATKFATFASLIEFVYQTFIKKHD